MRFLPRWCYHCHLFISAPFRSANRYLCRSCYRALPFQQEEVCSLCGLRHESSMCRSAWAKDISSFHAIFRHEPPVNQWIGGLKYSRNLIAGNLLTLLAEDWLRRHRKLYEDIDLAVPIPLHSYRLRFRGFNQSAFLLRRQPYFPVATNVVEKTGSTPRQVGLSREDRRKNLKDSFSVSHLEKGTNVLLFDDVCTSGQTIREASRTLQKAGAGKIRVLVLSRAM